MTREHFDALLVELHDDVIKMVSLVEERIKESIIALKSMNLDAAIAIIKKDVEINKMEHDIEEKCLKIIATQQPAAKDLREVVTTLKIITELERMGDYATDIAKMTRRLPDKLESNGLEQIMTMADKVIAFLKDAVDCFVKKDEIQALKLAVADDEIDSAYKKMLIWSMEYMRDHGRNAGEVLYLIFITKYLERIADRATNICEWAIFLSTGEHKELQ
jgi:phosphate transport system protein